MLKIEYDSIYEQIAKGAIIRSKKKKKKEKTGPKKKERVPFCREKKNFLCKRDL